MVGVVCPERFHPHGMVDGVVLHPVCQQNHLDQVALLVVAKGPECLLLQLYLPLSVTVHLQVETS